MQPNCSHACTSQRQVHAYCLECQGSRCFCRYQGSSGRRYPPVSSQGRCAHMYNGGVLQQHIDGDWHPIAYFLQGPVRTVDVRCLGQFSWTRYQQECFQMPYVGSKLHDKIQVVSLSWEMFVRACGEGIHQRLVIGEDVELAAFHKVPKVPDSEVHSEEFSIKGAVPRLSRSQSALSLEAVPLVMSETTILCDTSTGVAHPLVPSSFRQAVFHSLHRLSHPGIRATQRLVTVRYVWPSINADVRRWTRACVQCQKSKVQRHTFTPLSTFAVPGSRFDKMHIDIVGPLPSSNGYSYMHAHMHRSLHSLARSNSNS